MSTTDPLRGFAISHPERALAEIQERIELLQDRSNAIRELRKAGVELDSEIIREHLQMAVHECNVIKGWAKSLRRQSKSKATWASADTKNR